MADIRQKPAPLSVSGEVATVPEYVPQYIFIQRAILLPLLFRDVCLSLLSALSLLRAKVVVFPGYAHKAARGGLAMAAIAMAWNFYGEMFLILAYMFFYFSLFDYYGALKFFQVNHSSQKEGVGFIELYMPNGFRHIGHALTDPKRLLTASSSNKKLITEKAATE